MDKSNMMDIDSNNTGEQLGFEDKQKLIAKERLQNVTSEVRKLTQRIDSVRRRWQLECGKVASYIWMMNVLKKVPGYFDKLGPAKVRTAAGTIVETLMKTLLELDQVESFGDEKIRDRRRALVKRINTKLLPRADKLLIVTKQLVSKTESILTKYATILEQEHEQQEQLDDHKTTNNLDTLNSDACSNTSDSDDDSSDSDTEDEDDKEEDEPGSNANQTNQQEEEEEDHSNDNKMEMNTEEEEKYHRKQRSSPKTSQPKRKLDLRYKLEELQDRSVITIATPYRLQSENEIRVSLDKSAQELKVLVDMCEPLVFNVSSKRLNPMETTYRVTGVNTFVIIIPKQQARRTKRVSPERMDYPSFFHDSPFHRQQQRNPFTSARPNFMPIWG